ncbi:MAG: hypothetical protein JJU00_09230 [Opitutales bacterium]|nr:hypothetical protein [Opitutales bacterium]
MKKLTVFYDPGDARARAVRGFLARHAARIEVEVFPIDAGSVRMCFPELHGAPTGAALVTLSDTGILEHGEASLRTVLWALEGCGAWHRFGKEDAAAGDFERAVDLLFSGACRIEDDPVSLFVPKEDRPRRTAQSGRIRPRVFSGLR